MPVRLVRLVLECPMDCGAREQIPVRAVMGDATGGGYESGGVAQGHTTARCSVIWSEGLVFGLFLGVFLEEFLLHVAGHELV